MKMKDKKIIIVVISALLVITALAVWWYLSDRSETPENSLVVLSGGKENIIDISKLNLTTFNGTVVNGKGESKDIEGNGIKLSDIIDASDYSEVSVTSDDAYSVVVKKDEIEQAWLQIEDGEARLIVFGDDNSKRNVKHVVRIEVK
jgi:hypothetical protein